MCVCVGFLLTPDIKGLKWQKKFIMAIWEKED